MSDDIYEQSAAQALRIAQQVGRATQGGLAEEAGFKAIQHQAPQDAPLNEGQYSGGVGNAPGDVQAREMEANRDARRARQAILETGGLSMDDLLDLGMTDGGQEGQAAREMKRKMAAVAGHMVNQGARRVVQDAYMDPSEASMLMEQEAYRSPVTDAGWQVSKRSATLKSGKRVPVFMVEDTLTGMTTGKRYRLAAVAEKVAAVVNATGNPDDARIAMINRNYDQHVKLMQEKAQAKKSGNSGKARMLESQLQEVNARLGIG